MHTDRLFWHKNSSVPNREVMLIFILCKKTTVVVETAHAILLCHSSSFSTEGQDIGFHYKHSCKGKVWHGTMQAMSHVFSFRTMYINGMRFPIAVYGNRTEFCSSIQLGVRSMVLKKKDAGAFFNLFVITSAAGHS
jgi:hypothetical protein